MCVFTSKHCVYSDRTGAQWATRVTDQVLMALGDLRVQHIAVDTRSPDAVVYIKCANRGEAGRVYDLLNGFRLGGLHGECARA